MSALVMIAHCFAPEGNAGAQRPLRFVRQLSKRGWQITVVTSDPDSYERYDPETLKLVPEEVRVLRVRARRDPWQLIQAWRSRRSQEGPTQASGGNRAPLQIAEHGRVRASLRVLVRTAEAWWYHPDLAMPWIRPAIDASVEACKREAPAALWTTAGPVSSFVVAEQVSRRTGVPYVLDFRDPWTIAANDFDDKRPKWATAADRRAMYRRLKGARSVVFLYETVAQCYWEAYPGALDRSQIHIIPNGYEGTIVTNPGRVSDRCTILYTGTLSSYRYDSLLQSLCILKESDPVRARRLRLLVVGESAAQLAQEARSLGLEDVIEARHAISRAEVSRLQRDADALLILGRYHTMKGHELLVGAKLFDYLHAGRPIIGILPADETKNTLHRLGVTTVANVDSSFEIVAVLRSVIDAWSQGALQSLVPDASACAVYSAERQTDALVRALEGVPSAEPFVPGRSEIPPSLRPQIGNGDWLTQAL